MKALIDADSLLYKVGFALEDKIDWDNNEAYSYYSNLEQQKRTIEATIDAILMATGCDDYELWLTGKDNFRDSNPLDYKQNRLDSRKPTDFSELKQWLLDKEETHIADGYEADDVVVWKKTNYHDDYILCAIDKDVLYQTVGSHYNYGKDEIVEVKSELEVLRFAYYQTLAGDTTDGYKGVPGIGDKKAKKILEDCKNERDMWLATLLTYRSKGLRLSDAINTMRLANMHQFNGSKIVLWIPPKK